MPHLLQQRVKFVAQAGLRDERDALRLIYQQNPRARIAARFHQMLAGCLHQLLAILLPDDELVDNADGVQDRVQMGDLRLALFVRGDVVADADQP